MPGLKLPSFAKVNLGLWVGKKRPDGFHEVVTIVVPIRLCDTVSIRTTNQGIEVSTDTAAVPGGPGNLAHRAAAAFLEAAGLRCGCRIHIEKKIPVGAGLGGGSSNAATVLLGLNRLFGQPLEPGRLRKLAASLGSDVPAFLCQGPCVARGRGEKTRPVRLPRLGLVLHLPGYSVSTAWAYRAFDQRRLTSPAFSPKILALSLRRRELGKAARQIRNSFEPVVFNRHPDLARSKRLLLEHGARAASLSGSGSTVYGLVEEARADPMAALVRRGYRCIRTSSVLPQQGSTVSGGVV